MNDFQSNEIYPTSLAGYEQIDLLSSPKEESPCKVLIIVPHGASHSWVLKHFPTLKNYFTRDFETYLRIERDFGALEIAASLQKSLEKADVVSKVISLNYNRGILDGGRAPGHELRQHLPKSFLNQHGSNLKQLHQSTVTQIESLCHAIKKEDGIIVDLHTMAPFSPSNHSTNQTEISSSNIEAYVKGFKSHSAVAKPRPIDILSHDENGKAVADLLLSEITYEAFKLESFDIAFNDPYLNHSKYMMNRYLKHANGIAIDFPKHIFSKQALDKFVLDEFDLDQRKIDKLAQILSRAIEKRLNTQV